ncbi:sensory transduction histidine kinase [gamma proteobacterium NOR5-3]|nr:sensory transduction histidine kinase [gamma proteobacterium NOR5-3]
MRQSSSPDKTTQELKTGGAASLYQDLFGRLGLGVAVYEPFRDGEDFRFVDLNAQALFLSEVSLSDVKGRLLSECFPGAKDMGIIDALRRVHRTGTRESLAPQRYQDARRDKWFRNDIFRLVDGNIVAVYTDVTADMQSAEALHESETRYRLLTESLT